MLILSRKEKESIKIGETIEVFVTRISGNRVSLGVRAPDGVTVLRAELEERPTPPPRSEGDGVL